mmetsp:Transcript_67277/g.150137  ORF Transcript_67277/g.150137 Transcript_67277/m.150137 type:complete len:178 (+) Transcript_67277:1299-1832(+)
MLLPACPMVYVNPEFCRVTGYSKREAQGRNCRFLQGPLTEPGSIRIIQDALRNGVDCHVKVTNYRKDGETFGNLLTLRPLHDASGAYRFCIGVQFEVSLSKARPGSYAKLARVAKLIECFPKKLPGDEPTAAPSKSVLSMVGDPTKSEDNEEPRTGQSSSLDSQLSMYELLNRLAVT